MPSDDDVLTWDSSLASNQKWVPVTGGSGIPETLLDAKGDLIVASAADTAARLAVGGTNGHVLTVDSGETLGVKWAAGGSLPGAWTGYTPALTASVTNPTLGSGSSAVGRYTQIGNLVVVHIDISFGTSGVAAGSGYYIVSVPVTGYDDGVGYSAVAPCGFLQDISTGARRLVSAFWDNTSRDRFGLTTETGNVTNSSPWTWAASDQLKLSLFYEAA